MGLTHAVGSVDNMKQTDGAGKRSLGQYYTPELVADALAGWVTDVRDPVVLDPCYGRGALLYSALRALAARGFGRPASRLFGVDIDPDAQSYLEPLLRAGGSSDHFLTSDFLDVVPSMLGVEGFSSVLANPPYTRHHLIGRPSQDTAIDRLAESCITLSRKASYWAFFVLHSLRFLRASGRLGFVLPVASLYADYARTMWERLSGAFRSVHVLLLTERVFRDTQERTVLLLADCWGAKGRGVRFGVINEAGELGAALANPVNCTHEVNEADGHRAFGLVRDPVARWYESVALRHGVTRLGCLVKIDIGVVTGANRHLILRAGDVNQHNPCAVFLKPIVTRSVDLAGLEFTACDLLRVVSSGRPCFLISPAATDVLPEDLVMHLRRLEAQGIHLRYHCRRRVPWYAVPRVARPGAFLTYMSGRSPRIVVNSTPATCTNAIHRLYRVNCAPEAGFGELKRLALGSLTTLFQVSCELEGRSYGGGVLKVEPGEAKRLLVPFPMATEDMPSLFAEANSLMRAGDVGKATALVDDRLLIRPRLLTAEEMDRLRSLLDLLRARRGQPLVVV